MKKLLAIALATAALAGQVRADDDHADGMWHGILGYSCQTYLKQHDTAYESGFLDGYLISFVDMQAAIHAPDKPIMSPTQYIGFVRKLMGYCGRHPAENISVALGTIAAGGGQ